VGGLAGLTVGLLALGFQAVAGPVPWAIGLGPAGGRMACLWRSLVPAQMPMSGRGKLNA